MTKIPLRRRVMPTIIATDIKGVSPFAGPSEAVLELTKQQRATPDPDKWDSMDARPGDTQSPVVTPPEIEDLLEKKRK